MIGRTLILVAVLLLVSLSSVLVQPVDAVHQSDQVTTQNSLIESTHRISPGHNPGCFSSEELNASVQENVDYRSSVQNISARKNSDVLFNRVISELVKTFYIA